MRTFETGATRNTDDSKLDFEGFLSPFVLERFAEYMHSHRKQADGVYRAADNWQRGMPLEAYMKSGWRHFFSWWKSHRGLKTEESIEESICALIFNAQGYLHELLKEKHESNLRPTRVGTEYANHETEEPVGRRGTINGRGAALGATITTETIPNIDRHSDVVPRRDEKEGEPASETLLGGKCSECGGRIGNQYHRTISGVSAPWHPHPDQGKFRDSRHIYDYINHKVICIEESIQ